jgi:glyoxylase I family protein
VTEDLLETLLRIESALAAADPAGIDGGLVGLIADDFREFGASGRTWDAAAMRQTLAGAEPADPVDLDDFTVAVLAPGVALVTYRLGQPRPSNRSSVWVRREGRWQVRFHQGTLRPE